MNFGALLDAMAGKRILVVGDLMLDEYIVGKATRISPEAPVMVVRHQSTRRLPGGAANVALNVLALGGHPTVVGVVGDDETAGFLEGAMRGQGLDSIEWVRVGDRPTTRKTRVLADHAHQVLRIDAEDDTPLGQDAADRLLGIVESQSKGVDGILISDYRKGTVDARLCEKAIAIGRLRRIPVVANPKPSGLDAYRGATLVSLNRFEAAQALGMERGLDDAQASVAARRLGERIDGIGLVTLGESGMAAHVDGRDVRVGAPTVEVSDTAGAGDTVIATVALGLAANGSPETVFHLAAQTSSAVVRKVGVAVPSASDLAKIRAKA